MFYPPFRKSVKTNIGRKFINIIKNISAKGANWVNNQKEKNNNLVVHDKCRKYYKKSQCQNVWKSKQKIL